MKTLALATVLAVASSAAFAQQAPTMDPAVVEAEAVSSNMGLIVPLLTVLVFVAALSNMSGSNVMPPG